MPGMDTIQDQIRVLQTSVRRQRFAIVTLASILAGSALIGAVRPAGDATFDTITCKKWRVVDKDGTARIIASTLADGSAGVVWWDKDGKGRISASTRADGTVIYPTKDGK
jgi:cobalamin biosynthesis protein CbiG